jgi:hypothetical protein
LSDLFLLGVCLLLKEFLAYRLPSVFRFLLLMGIGHVAVGLALKRGDQKINVGWLVFAALLPDFLLGWFVLAGLESYAAPPNYASVHYLLFTFPWSHGLVADMVWAALAGLTVFVLSRRRPAAVITGIALLPSPDHQYTP